MSSRLRSFARAHLIHGTQQTGQVTYDSVYTRNHDKYTIVLSYNETGQLPIVQLLLCVQKPELNVRFHVLPYGKIQSEETGKLTPH